MPRVAAQLDRSAVSDVVAVKGPKTFVRGIYAGALLATVEVDEDVVVGTVRTTAFEPAGEADMPVRIENITVPEEAVNWDATQFVRFTETESDRPDLVSAKVVVAGGRGLIDEAGFSSFETADYGLLADAAETCRALAAKL